jgi:hypothetical protein
MLAWAPFRFVDLSNALTVLPIVLQGGRPVNTTSIPHHRTSIHLISMGARVAMAHRTATISILHHLQAKGRASSSTVRTAVTGLLKVHQDNLNMVRIGMCKRLSSIEDNDLGSICC